MRQEEKKGRTMTLIIFQLLLSAISDDNGKLK